MIFWPLQKRALTSKETVPRGPNIHTHVWFKAFHTVILLHWTFKDPNIHTHIWFKTFHTVILLDWTFKGPNIDTHVWFKTFHTVILLVWTFKKWGHSNSPFLHCMGFIGTLNKKKFLKNWEGLMKISNLSSQISTWTELDRAWDIFWIRQTMALNEIMWPKKLQITSRVLKVPFWQFFRLGRDGRALLVLPSRIPHRVSKIIFALGANEFQAMLDGRIRETPFF